MVLWLLTLTLGTALGFICVYISLSWFLKKINQLKLDIERLKKLRFSANPRG